VTFREEAHRTLKPFGHLFIVEPRQRWEKKLDELRTGVEAAGFQHIGEIEQRYDFIYLAAVRR
jgi:hypothetical protein